MRAAGTAWDTLMLREKPSWIAGWLLPATLKSSWSKRARCQQKQIDEMGEGVRFELVSAFLRGKCNEEWIQLKEEPCGALGG